MTALRTEPKTVYDLLQADGVTREEYEGVDGQPGLVSLLTMLPSLMESLRRLVEANEADEAILGHDLGNGVVTRQGRAVLDEIDACLAHDAIRRAIDWLDWRNVTIRKSQQP